MVDLERDRAQKQDEKAVVDHRVHETGGPIPHERLHPQAGAQGFDALLPMTGALVG